MALSPADIRRTLRAHLDAVGKVGGWVEAPGVPDLLGQDPRAVLHLGYSVAMPSTAPISQDRQGRGGTHTVTVAQSQVLVRWSYRLPANDQRTGYDLALEAEAEMVRLALSCRADELVLRYGTASRATTADGSHLLGTITLTCLHTLDLAE